MVFSPVPNSVYIGDYTHQAIHKLDLETGNYTKIDVYLTSGVTSLALAGDNLYWTETSLSDLFWINIHHQYPHPAWQELNSSSFSDDKLQVTPYTMTSHPPSSACSSLDCSHVCLNTEPHGAVCLCPLGLELESDGTCV